MKNVLHHRDDCRACGSMKMDMVLSLKPSPIGDAYVTSEKLDVTQHSYPIDLYQCEQCGLAQLTDVLDPSVLYGEYIYVTGSSLGLFEHFRAYAQTVKELCGLSPNSLIIDIGSNDGTLLKCFKEIGMQTLGIEPAEDIAAMANKEGITTINNFLTPELADEIVLKYGHADLITSNNVFANIDDLNSWVTAIEKLLDKKGIYIFESYYLADVIKNMVFDFIYHEHLSAFSVKPIKKLFEKAGLELIAVQHVDTKGGSLRYIVQRPGGPIGNDGSVEQYLANENDEGLYVKETYNIFSNRINILKDKSLSFLKKIKEEGKTVAGFGASITGTTLIYHFEIGKYIDYLVDDNLAKQGRFSPGLHLPVFPSEVIYEKYPDYIIILAWRFADPFMDKHLRYLQNGGAFIIPVPQFKVIKNG